VLWRFERGGLLDREVGRLGPLKYLVYKVRGTPEYVSDACPVGNQTARLGVFALRTYRRQTILLCECSNLNSVGVQHRA
jgi:hypothetical protein